ncbi:APC family permease [Allomuricauda sp. F6463D]|uniref:APC family permease n=1 Tax=Allomuricauda sp. F6463D TaxID=2926409 RepID=UPI001FF3379A|nr:amino acid permease [Muricauda sp. F6463D]MCK0159991.1 amino acid permease [Muricauda sp. F6463D]
MSKYKIGTMTGVAIVVANMIGTGVFTSLGFQLKDLNNVPAILTLWVMGGILALSGAFSYAEVGTVIKKSGGEFAFLSTIYGPLVGYLSGWVSLTVGFAAPIALSAIAVVEYFPYESANVKLIGIALIALITLIHVQNLRTSSKFQNIGTLLKVILIVGIIIFGMATPVQTHIDFDLGANYFREIGSTAFAVALIYVSYSYSGWNAAAYITEEFKKPSKSLPIALVGGTFLVTVLYVLLQYIFLRNVPLDELVGQIDIGSIAAKKMLGEQYGNLFGVAISLLLISGISAMVWVGPRVTSSMAKVYGLWGYFKPIKQGEIPKRALWLQFSISCFLILTGTFEQILVYCGVLLSISSLLVVVGVFKLRKSGNHQDNGAYKSPLFPLFQILYIGLSLWMIIFVFMNNTYEAMAGLFNLILGLATYYINKRMYNTKIKQ